MVRRLGSSFVLLLAAANVYAQPVDPYAEPGKPAKPTPAPKSAPPAPAPLPPLPPPPLPPPNAWSPPAAVPPGAQDPLLAEQVAISLVDRAQELIDSKMYLDAKQLAVEAVVKSPTGPAAERARVIINRANAALGIVEAPPRGTSHDQVKITDDKFSDQLPVPPPADATTRSGKTASLVHGALFGGTVGAMIGSFFADNEAAGAVPMGIALGAVGALTAPMLAKKYHATASQVRTVGAGSVWGGVIGGLIGGTAEGADGGTTTGSGVLVGATIGSAVGILGTIGFAQDKKLTTGDVALVDTLGGIGTVGGLTIGMLMQPAQREAYSLNSALGAAAGVVVGFVLAPQVNTTPRRMIRVAGLSIAGGALPFLLYAGIHDKHASWDERLTGGLSSLGLLGGAVLGFYLTRHVDEGLDVPDGGAKKLEEPDDAPLALVGRSSAGKWNLGGVGVAPLSTTLVTGAPQKGMAFSLVGATF
jgi:hypothetical protein